MQSLRLLCGGVLMTPNELQILMQKCPQTSTQSVWDHGVSVRGIYNEIIGGSVSGIKSPDWLKNWSADILKSVHPITISGPYCLWHDCGKPFCRVETDTGPHFPEHAAWSKRIYADIYGSGLVSNLIGWDMEIHTATAVQIEQYLQEWTRADACTLLVAALAEIHSNARMFGGIESTSFKIKFKQVEKRGNQICRKLFDHQ